MADLSGILPAAGVALEAQAYRTFGAIVANQTNNVFGNIFGTAAGATINQNVNPLPEDRILRHGDWNVTPYASALASGAGGYDPKTKFLFKVHFEFYSAAAVMAANLGLDPEFSLNRDLTYVVKQIDMPKYSFDYEEVNMYNFRTKVLKKINHEALNFTFYDDTANNAIKFMSIYLQLLQPIARRKWDAGINLEDYGFGFSRALGGPDSGMRGALRPSGNQPAPKDILRSLRIEQFYLNRSQSHLHGEQVRQALYVNVFHFTNPRITNFTLSDQDHEQGAMPNTLECQFDFDALYMDTGKIADTIDKADSGLLATYDILTGENRSGGQFLSGPTTPAGGGGGFLSAFTNLIANQGGRYVQTEIANALHKSAIGEIGGGALAGAISTAAGALGNATRRTLGMNGMTPNGIIAPKRPAVADNSAGGQTKSQFPITNNS